MINETYKLGYCINVVGSEWILGLGVMMGFLLAVGISIALFIPRYKEK